MSEWDELTSEINSCKKCGLCEKRKNAVIGRGNTSANIFLIGEGPGEHEDKTGEAFVGPAGQLLDMLLDAQKIKPEDYYISNVVKCRPPGNRVPLDDEANSCLDFLRRQVKLVNPKVLVCLGATALKYIVDQDARITKVRGSWIERKNFYIMPTFHPAALLRDDSKKQLLWNDFKVIKKKLDEIKRNA